MSLLQEQINQSSRSRRLFPRGQPILVAVSGGLDSMVLLHILCDLAPRNDWKLTVAHLNHQLRGRSSDADERLVRLAAKRLNLPLAVGRANVHQFARAHKLSIEMAARTVRHDFLARTASRLRIPCVALAHHADDQLELFFLRLLRGSGGEGLAGMLWRSPSPAGRTIELVRPFLDVPKPTLHAYAVEMRIHYREDATNTRLDIQRNRIRHELLPLLRREYQPALARTVLRSMDIVAAEAKFVTQAAVDWLRHQQPSKAVAAEGRRFRSYANSDLGLQTSTWGVASSRRLLRFGDAPFERLPLAVQRRCVQLQLMRLGVTPDFDLVEQLRANANKLVSIGDRRAGVLRKPNGLVHLRQTKPAAFRSASLEVCLSDTAGQVAFSGTTISWQIHSQGLTGQVKTAPGCELFDGDRVGPHILLRHWQPGDQFQPIGMKGRVKLQDFFTNQKIPRARRRELIVALTKEGEIFWVEGLRISERFKLTRQTIRRLQWRWQQL